MNGGLKGFRAKNGRLLLALAIIAGLAFVAAWFLDQAPGDNTAETDAEKAAAVEQRQPLSDTEMGNAVRALFEDGGYQTELPEAPEPVERRSGPGLPPWVGTVIWYTLVGAGILSIATFIWVLVTGNPPRRPIAKAIRKIADKPREKATAPDHVLARHATLEEARALAADGRYGEAVRKLLAVSLISLARRELVRIRPWMTGREIVRDARLAQETATALRELVMTVETYAFAGDEVSSGTYDACLAHCLLLTQNKAG